MSLFGKVFLVLILIFLIPTGLVLASQDALPGDAAYPIKRELENGIFAVASLTPQSKAFFSSNLSQRRFKEALALVKRNDERSSESLTALVSQTQAAATDIQNISDPAAKQEYVANLTKQIDEYRQGFSNTQINTQPNSVPSPVSIVQPTVIPTIKLLPGEPTPTVVTSTPTLVPPSPTPVPSSSSSGNQQVDDTLKQLDQIKKDLEKHSNKGDKKEDQKKSDQKPEKQNKQDKQDKKDNSKKSD